MEAGGALAVDRHGFARLVTERVRSHPNITVIERGHVDPRRGTVIVASGPLTSDALSAAIAEKLGDGHAEFLRCRRPARDLRERGYVERVVRLALR